MPNHLLKPFSIVYDAITAARNALFEKGYFEAKNLGLPTISVGNITVGGTGKTPMVALIAKILSEMGRKPCVLTRGYGRENPNRRVVISDGQTILAGAKISGDEPFELANKLLGISAVIADAQRFEAGIWAKANLKSNAFVLDDGFQHRKLKRDLDIVLIDATNPFSNDNLLPKGTLRESLNGLKRADVFIITRTNLVGEDEIEQIKLRLSKYNSNAPILLSQTKIRQINELNGDSILQIESLKAETKFLAFCGLGNPENFYASLRRENVNLIATKSFADHYVYRENDILEIQNSAHESSAKILLTTAKDATKLTELEFKIPCYAVEIEAVIDNEQILRERLLKIL